MKILKINTLERGWHDKDEILLHAAFQILTDFMEKEKPGERIDYTWDAEHRRIWKELNFLYKWWTVTRPNRKDPLDDPTIEMPPTFFREEEKDGQTHYVYFRNSDPQYRRYWRAMEKSQKLEEKWIEEDQKNLERLITIRHHLWT